MPLSKKIRFDDCIYQTQITDHSDIKEDVLDEINLTEDIDDVHASKDSFARLDWSFSYNLRRPWVEYFLPVFRQQLSVFCKEFGYPTYDVDALWFQQYQEKDEHTWHIHSNHYTGVYYLEYQAGCGKTAIRSPYNSEEMEMDVTEGDLIIFPAHWIHRGMPNSKDRKTIISFNFNIRCPSESSSYVER